MSTLSTGAGLTVAIVSASAYDERPVLGELGVSLVLPKPLRRQGLTDLVGQVNGLVEESG